MTTKFAELSAEWEKVRALYASHPELFVKEVSLSLYSDSSRLLIFGDIEMQREFARQHPEAKWEWDTLGNWDGVLNGLRLSLMRMRPAPEQSGPVEL